MSQRLRVSVVVPSLNSPMIDRVLDALRCQNVAPLEVLVVGLDQLGLVREDALVRLLSTGQPVSPARARNLGAQAARGEVICYTDADCIARPDWIARLLERHSDGAQVVGGGVAVDRDDYWRLCDNVVAFTPFLASSAPGPRPYLPSLNLSIRRTLLEEFGGFDERFPFASGEDTDLSFRLRRAGHTLWFDPRAAVLHQHMRASPGDLWRHLYMFGKTYMEIYPRYPDILGSWRRIRIAAGMPDLLQLLSPALAVADVIERIVRQPSMLAYVGTIPGQLLGMWAWYHGAAAALRHYREPAAEEL
jgi:glycosyltransferase involved in cell wall biosynthesis